MAEVSVVSDEDGPKTRVLIAVSDGFDCQALAESLNMSGFTFRCVTTASEALDLVEHWPFALALVDSALVTREGGLLIDALCQCDLSPVCIAMIDEGNTDAVVDVLHMGALGIVTRPSSVEAVSLMLMRAYERHILQAQVIALRRRVKQRALFGRTSIIGNSAAVKDLRALISQVAPARATVLITGESGTGKDLVARMIHEQSRRATGPFVALHCAALSEAVLESELFGHERGSFTGATMRRQGRFEEAHGGTLFLDEIGDLSAAVQLKLLRFLQHRQFERVGSNKTVSVDVRLVAATHRNLKAEVRDGRFREDLYYRLNVIHLEVPPLRARREDIPMLLRHFVSLFSKENDKEIASIDPVFSQMLLDYEWPGNVRELENLVQRAVVLTRGTSLRPTVLPPDFHESFSNETGQVFIPGSRMADIERYAILKTYEHTGGSTARTAEVLGISVRKVRYKLRDYATGDVVN